jgi:hypothetical protein
MEFLHLAPDWNMVVPLSAKDDAKARAVGSFRVRVMHTH